MKVKPLSIKTLEDIEISISPKGGFTLWVWENGRRHWLIDASVFREDGIIRLGNETKMWNYEAKYHKKDNSIRLIHNGKKLKTIK